MKIEFDERKDAQNQQKHGLSLALAARMDLETALRRRDARYDYGEKRLQALGLINGRLHMLIYTVRGASLRAISLRKANTREEQQYATRHQGG